jgi:uncharacterized protein
MLFAVALGVLIGLSLGALGGGGSILTVPALVYVLNEPARAATTESLVIVGITALVAAVGHSRAGHVRWAAGLTVGLIGVVASYAGTALNRSVDPDVLLLAFAGLIVIAAAAMLMRIRGGGSQASSEHAAVGAGAHGAVTAAKVVAAGLLVGFLTGFFGVGGGFVIVPALVMALGYEMPIAVGTSLLVIAINSAAALLARAGHETLHWSVIIPFTLAAIVGSLAGKRVADKVSPLALTRAFVVLLFVVAIYVAVRSTLALTG